MRATVRKATSLALVVSGSFTMVTGLWNFLPPFSETFSPGHAVGACVFSALCLVHVWLNWTAIRRYLTRSAWGWALIALGLVASAMIVVIPLARM
jgi:hypothetical protein